VQAHPEPTTKSVESEDDRLLHLLGLVAPVRASLTDLSNRISLVEQTQIMDTWGVGPMDADDLADYGRDSNVHPRDPEADAAHDDVSDEQRELYDNANDFHPYFIEVYS